MLRKDPIIRAFLHSKSNQFAHFAPFAFPVNKSFSFFSFPPRFSCLHLTTSDKSNLIQVQTIGQKLRELREKDNLLLRQVAAALEMDTALLSKIERDERKPSKEQVLAFAKYYKVQPDDLLVAWLSDRLTLEVKDENHAEDALKMTLKKIRKK